MIQEILESNATEAELFGDLNFQERRGTAMPPDIRQDFQENVKRFNIEAPLVGVNQTTRNEVSSLVKRAARDNKTAGELVKDLTTFFDRTGDQARRSTGRAFTIARTEMGRIANSSILTSGRLAGDTNKVWIWSRVQRDFHASMDGQTVPIDRNFRSGLGNEAPAPHQFGLPEEDINCKCTIVTMIDLNPDDAEDPDLI